MSSDASQEFTVAPRDASSSFEEAQEAISRALSAIPGVRVTDADPKNRIAIIEVPNDLVEEVRGALEDRFFVDPNARLRF